MSPRTQWEYKETSVSLDYRTKELNVLGQEGWELVQIMPRHPGEVHLVIWLKRLLEPMS